MANYLGIDVGTSGTKALVITAKEHADWATRLPFFSQVTLKQHAERLRQFGMKVHLTRIDRES